ncbi:glucokinase [Antarcticibacterium sp. 1MA-6-2]|uniref:glucokinase n=1 Tax=Antarcticibacterium sp. 1MA-6-2 TaxID=2908210 RepID=UPI001F2F5B10|nr:glucokinase [Antarcticibacterium sp. 1MA-6-2]UJH91665.1 glucokinase [Antarcticibacterium sp. 1MA-6-2]
MQDISLKIAAGSTIKFPIDNIDKAEGVVLAGDVGGTKTNIALFRVRNGFLQPLLERTYQTKAYSSFFQLYEDFQKENCPAIDSICLGVAGPVIEGKVSGTNFSWEVDENEIKQRLGIRKVAVINDLEANAYGLALLDLKDLKEIKGGKILPGNAAIISPGTGLGEAGLYWDGKFFHPFPAEGGHCDFSPRNELDVLFWRFLHEEFGRVSWERIISGRGLQNIYRFLLAHHGTQEPEWFKERILNEDPAAVISESARDGNYDLAKESINLFVRYLATETAQLALKLKATGGIYIGGGIMPKILPMVDVELFQSTFMQIGKMHPLMEKIVVNIVLNAHTAKHGTALYATMKLRE